MFLTIIMWFWLVTIIEFIILEPIHLDESTLRRYAIYYAADRHVLALKGPFVFFNHHIINKLSLFAHNSID